MNSSLEQDSPNIDRILPSRSGEVFEDTVLAEQGWTQENIRRLINQNPREFAALNPVEKNLKIGSGAIYRQTDNKGNSMRLVGDAQSRNEGKMTLGEYK